MGPGRIKDVMFSGVHQAAAPVSGRVVCTRGKVCYLQLPCIYFLISAALWCLRWWILSQVWFLLTAA